jgi:glycogen debranching enzyme
MEDEGFYAYALDPDKRQVKSIASNPGHLLWSGIVDGDDKASRVARRLLAPDMFSGWGIRTLSKNNAAYDPNAYQLGSVWPHDNAFMASGFKRYGFWRETNTVAKAIFDAAGKFQMYRLPEVFAGSDRRPESFPVEYQGANIPQAWAAGSVFLLLRAILGINANAPENTLFLNPTLPDWLPDITLSNFHVGDQVLTIRFTRDGERSKFDVLAGGKGLTILEGEQSQLA